jgi:hypothetical protein
MVIRLHFDDLSIQKICDYSHTNLHFSEKISSLSGEYLINR